MLSTGSAQRLRSTLRRCPGRVDGVTGSDCIHDVALRHVDVCRMNSGLPAGRVCRGWSVTGALRLALVHEACPDGFAVDMLLRTPGVRQPSHQMQPTAAQRGGIDGPWPGNRSATVVAYRDT